ncbi:MAG: hypothetical protein RR379_10900 [Clostridia bacterium]
MELQKNPDDIKGIRKLEMPPPLLRHSYASASVATDILIRKNVNAMPLCRQEQMWNQCQQFKKTRPKQGSHE